jgi:hypothetical protein
MWDAQSAADGLRPDDQRDEHRFLQEFLRYINGVGLPPAA